MPGAGVAARNPGCAFDRTLGFRFRRGRHRAIASWSTVSDHARGCAVRFRGAAGRTSGCAANDARKVPTWSGLRPTQPWVWRAHVSTASRPAAAPRRCGGSRRPGWRQSRSPGGPLRDLLVTPIRRSSTMSGSRGSSHLTRSQTDHASCWTKGPASSLPHGKLDTAIGFTYPDAEAPLKSPGSDDSRVVTHALRFPVSENVDPITVESRPRRHPANSDVLARVQRRP